LIGNVAQTKRAPFTRCSPGLVQDGEQKPVQNSPIVAETAGQKTMQIEFISCPREGFGIEGECAIQTQGNLVSEGILGFPGSLLDGSSGL
jgi:hypothetical protein